MVVGKRPQKLPRHRVTGKFRTGALRAGEELFEGKIGPSLVVLALGKTPLNKLVYGCKNGVRMFSANANSGANGQMAKWQERQEPAILENTQLLNYFGSRRNFEKRVLSTLHFCDS